MTTTSDIAGFSSKLFPNNKKIVQKTIKNKPKVRMVKFKNKKR